MRVKNHYKGMFRLTHELLVLYCYAYSKEQAWMIFCRRISDKHNVSLRTVMNYFNGHADNYEVTIKTEWEEG